MVRVDIETIIMTGGPVPSVIVLRERPRSSSSDAPTRSLSIQTGAYEAAAISRGIDRPTGERPITSDLMVDVIEKLGARLERVEIDRVEAPIFYAKLVLAASHAPAVEDDEKINPVDCLIRVDARPSDALALAVRFNAPVFVEDDVMNRAGAIGYRPDTDVDDEAEIERFDQFVQNLSPDDF